MICRAGEANRRRRDTGVYWTHCKTCGQLLIYTVDRNAKPQECEGRKR